MKTRYRLIRRGHRGSKLYCVDTLTGRRASLPDTIEDDRIESVERLEAMMDEYLHLRQKARDVFELRYKETIDPDQNRWELCSRVLARKDVVGRLSEPWQP